MDSEYIKELEAKLSKEIGRRKEAETLCSVMESELNSDRNGRKTSESKYNKLLTRYNVVSKKLKVAEDRCMALLDAMNDDDEFESSELGLFEEEDEYSREESDEAEEEGYMEKVLELPLHRKSVRKVDTSDFELDHDIMEALVATAINDISK